VPSDADAAAGHAHETGQTTTPSIDAVHELGDAANGRRGAPVRSLRRPRAVRHARLLHRRRPRRSSRRLPDVTRGGSAVRCGAHALDRRRARASGPARRVPRGRGGRRSRHPRPCGPRHTGACTNHPGLPVRGGRASAAQRALHPSGVESTADLPDGPIDGVVIANELLDNLPVPAARVRRHVARGTRHGAARPAPRGARAVARRGPRGCPRAPHGARVPWQAVGGRLGRRRPRRLRDGDACCASTTSRRPPSELAGMPWREWLRTYRGHERGGHYLAQPAEQDVTTQVALDQLPPPDAVRTPGAVPAAVGDRRPGRRGSRRLGGRRSAPTVAAMKMRSRVREAEALLDPAGLGAFLAVEWVHVPPGDTRARSVESRTVAGHDGRFRPCRPAHAGRPGRYRRAAGRASTAHDGGRVHRRRRDRATAGRRADGRLRGAPERRRGRSRHHRRGLGRSGPRAADHRVDHEVTLSGATEVLVVGLLAIRVARRRRPVPVRVRA
jgi:hypothetical protein